MNRDARGEISGDLAGSVQRVAEMWTDALRGLSGVTLPANVLPELQAAYLRDAAALWNQATSSAAETPVRGDRRFSGQDWLANPTAAYTAGMYLLNARTLMQLADNVQADEKTRQRIRFGVQQWIDAASPSNYLALNPEAQRRALDTHGESIARGLQHLWNDIRQGHLSQTDESVFEVGRNVAMTPGAVVYENELFQLVEYAPITEKVHEQQRPLVPPCINKFYILDLQPDNSLIRYTVEQGHRTLSLIHI